MNRRQILKLGTAALALPGTAAFAQDRLNVVATTGMLADALRVVGQDLVDVRGLMGPGVDPHAYRQTRSDIVAMTRADLVVWHGLFLEAQMEDFFERLGKSRKVTALADMVPETQLISHADYAGRFDPHIWMDPKLWAFIVAGAGVTLSELRPEAEPEFRARAEAHIDEILALDAYATDALSSVPPEARVLVTAHDAFGYFGKAYGFEVIGIQGISTESEAGLNRISELVDLLVERGIKAVFVESSVSDRNMRALIEGAASRGHEVQVGGELFSDAMGPDGTYEGTYLGMIDHNITTIARALGATVDPAGRLGRLSVGG